MCGAGAGVACRFITQVEKERSPGGRSGDRVQEMKEWVSVHRDPGGSNRPLDCGAGVISAGVIGPEDKYALVRHAVTGQSIGLLHEETTRRGSVRRKQPANMMESNAPGTDGFPDAEAEAAHRRILIDVIQFSPVGVPLLEGVSKDGAFAGIDGLPQADD